MTETEARLLIMSRIADMAEAHAPFALAVEQPGHQTIDETLQVQPFVRYFLDFMGADQAELGGNPLVKYVGQLQLHAVYKENTGEMEGAALRTFMRPFFSAVNLGGIQFHVAEPHRGAVIKNWQHLPLLLNFYFFSPNQ